MPVIYLPPDSTDGATVFTNAIGAATVHEAIDDPHGSPSSLHYALSGSATNNMDMRVGMTDLPGTLSSAVIDGVTLLLQMLDHSGISAYGRDWRPYVRLSGTNYNGTTRTAGTPMNSIHVEVEEWEKSPATGVRWTVAEVNGAIFGVETLSLGADQVAVVQLEAAVSYQPLVGESGRVTENESRRLLKYRDGFPTVEMLAPLDALDLGILEDFSLIDYMAPDASGAGWTADDPRMLRVMRMALDPNTMTARITARDLRRGPSLVTLWMAAETEISAGNTENGVAKVTRGNTWTHTRATKKWVENPGFYAASAIQVVEMASGYAGIDRRGLLIEKAATNLMDRSSFVSQLTGWTTAGAVTADSDASDSVFEQSITAYSARLAGNGATIPSITNAAAATVTGAACISIDYNAHNSAADLYLRVQRSSDSFYLQSNGTWNAAAADLVIGQTGTWTRYQLGFNVGAGAETLTVRIAGSVNTVGKLWNVYHVQLETGLYATSRIVTDAATVTRNADVVTLAQPVGKEILLVAGHSGAVTIVPEWNTADITANRTLVHWVGDADNQFLVRYNQASSQFEFVVEGTAVFGIAFKAHTVVRGTPVTVAWRWVASSNTASIYVDGVKGTDDGADEVIDSGAEQALYLGCDTSSGTHADAGFQHVKVTPFILTDAEMARFQ